MNTAEKLDSSARQRPWRRRVLLIVGALALLLAVGIPGCSWYNDYRFNQLLAQWGAMGEPDDLDGWLASQPCDLPLAREWQRWFYSDATTNLLEKCEEWFYPTDEWIGFAGVLAQPDDFSAAELATIAAGRALLERPGLDVTMSARCARLLADDPDWSDHPVPLQTVDQVGPFRNLRTLANYLAWRSTVDQPERALDHLDRLAAASAEADLILDALLHVTICDRRDHAYLTTIVDRRLSAGQAEAWIEQWQPVAPSLAQIQRRESACLSVPTLIAWHHDNDLDQAQTTTLPGGSPLRQPFAVLENIFSGAFFSHHPSGLLADLVDAETLLAEPMAHRPELLHHASIPGYTFTTLLSNDAVARGRRLAGWLALTCRDHQRLPKDLAPLTQQLQALVRPTDIIHPTLVATRLGPTRLAITIDRSAPGLLTAAQVAALRMELEIWPTPDPHRPAGVDHSQASDSIAPSVPSTALQR